MEEDKVLDHVSHENQVELIGWYGGDETHALSAWTSTKRELTEEKFTRIEKLLCMLAENGHHTPFEKSYLHFLVTAETASHIQLIKHRIGVSINGESARYKELDDDKFYLPVDWPNSSNWHSVLEDHILDSYTKYHQCLSELTGTLGRKRAKEAARFFLPYAIQLKFDVGFNFRSFMHFQNLRHKDDAQLEIRNIAKKMIQLVQEIPDNPFALSLKAFGYA